MREGYSLRKPRRERHSEPRGQSSRSAALYGRYANLESGLPKSQRDAITGLVFRVAQTVVNYRAKQEVEAKK